MTELPAGTITFVLTDIVGSTALWESAPEQMFAAVQQHHQILGELARANDGVLVKSQGEGDSSFAAFGRARDSLSFARDMLRAFRDEEWPTSSPIVVRVGIHTGEAEIRDGDYFGRAVNRCARLRSLAHGGQVLVSRATADLVEEPMPAGVSLRPLGFHRLRDLPRPEEVFQLSIEGLPDVFPDLGASTVNPNNLPHDRTPFVGREAELEQVGELIARARIVTLTGAGGAGKTRVAVRVGRRALAAYPGGVWFVELSPLRDDALVAPAAAMSMGILDTDAPRTAIAARVGASPVLFVLDNCEHVIAGAASFASALADVVPAATVLATSREPLRVAGEVVFTVPSLPVPAEAPRVEALAGVASVELFLSRAEAAGARIALTERNASAIATICRRLDGNPLAIELAAARASVLSPEEIVRRLDDRFSLLSVGARDAEPRQRTLAGAIAWSYDLLPEAERAVFTRLSVFPGSFGLEGAHAVAGGSRAGLLSSITSLVDRSLLVADTLDDPPRYRMLETVRAYAADRLRESDDAAGVRQAQLGWCLALLDGLTPDLRMTTETLDRIEEEYDNIRAAFDWARQRGDAEAMTTIAAALPPYWSMRGGTAEGAEWIAGALEQLDRGSPLRLRALMAGGYLAFDLRDQQVARARFTEALELAEGSGDARQADAAYAALGSLAHSEGDYVLARKMYEQALEGARSRGSAGELASLVSNLGHLAHAQREYAQAEQLYEEARARFEEAGLETGVAGTLRALGTIASTRRDYPRARALFEEALDLARKTKERPLVALLTADLGAVVHEEGDLHSAIALYEESLAVSEQLQQGASRMQVLTYLGEARRAVGDLPGARAALREALELARTRDMKLGIAVVERQLGEVARAQGSASLALEHFARALRASLDLSDPQAMAGTIESIAYTIATEEPESAVMLIAAATAAREAIGVPAPPSVRPEHERVLARARTALPADAFEQAWRRGTEESLDDAAGRALTLAVS